VKEEIDISDISFAKNIANQDNPQELNRKWSGQ